LYSVKLSFREHRQQPTARMPRLARPTISNDTQELHVLHIDFVLIHTEGILYLTCIKIHLLLAHWMIWNLCRQTRHTFSKRLPTPALVQADFWNENAS